MDAKLIEELKKAKKMVSVRGWNLPISWKVSYNISRYIKYLPVEKAIKRLEEVIELKRAIPYWRYNRDIPHRSNIDGGIKQGRYPVKASKYFIKLLKSLEKNAEKLGLDKNKLIIVFSSAYKGNTRPLKLNKGGYLVRGKSTHVEIYAMEIEQYDPNKRYKRKELKNLVKNILKEWYLKIYQK